MPDYHDTELLKPIENNKFSCSEEGVLRAFALAFHKKQETIRMYCARYLKKFHITSPDSLIPHSVEAFRAAVDEK